jgi:hypothetical protein
MLRVRRSPHCGLSDARVLLADTALAMKAQAMADLQMIERARLGT